MVILPKAIYKFYASQSKFCSHSLQSQKKILKFTQRHKRLMIAKAILRKEFCRRYDHARFQLTLQSHSNKHSRSLAQKPIHRSMKLAEGSEMPKYTRRKASSTNGPRIQAINRKKNETRFSPFILHKTQLPPTQRPQYKT